MLSTSTLCTLLSLSENEKSECEKQLGIAIRNTEQQKRHLDELLKRYDNLNIDFQSKQKIGISQQEYHHYYTFIDNLLSKTKEAKDNLKNAENNIIACQKQLTTSYLKYKSYSILENKNQKHLSTIMNKNEQKSNDTVKSFFPFNK